MPNFDVAKVAPTPRTTPTIDCLVGQISGRINNLYEVNARIGAGVSRLLNPIPEGVDGNTEKAAPNTIESRLQDCLNRLDAVLGHLNHNAERIDSAV